MSSYRTANICLLTFLCHVSKVFSITKINKYSRSNALDGRKCRNGDIVFDVRNTVSVTECSKFCSDQSSCSGISYKASTDECIGCNEQVFTNNVTDGLEDSRFYRLSECPDSDGRIQPEISFRIQIYKEEKSQSEATAHCERFTNGRLVILNEESKINAISNILNSCAGYNESRYWVNGIRLDQQTEWKFTDGGSIPMLQTTFWHDSSPNSPYSDTRCVHLKYRSNVDGFRFDDKRCSTMYRYICEY